MMTVNCSKLFIFSLYVGMTKLTKNCYNNNTLLTEITDEKYTASCLRAPSKTEKNVDDENGLMPNVNANWVIAL